MSLTCKNCGAEINYDKNRNIFICDFCNSSYSVNECSNGFVKIDGKSVSVDTINKYRYALDLKDKACTTGDYDSAAVLFAELGDLFDSQQLYKECVDVSRNFKREKDYMIACQRMVSNNNEILDTAYNIFVGLGDYKDSQQKALECKMLYQQNLAQEKDALKRAELDERKQNRKKKLKSFLKFCGVLLFVAVIGLGVLIYKHIDSKKYSRENVAFNFSAVENDFCVESGNHYVFTYNVIIENKGKLNINSIEGTVVFEDKDGNLLLNSNVNFSDYPVAVSAGEKAKFLWELSVYSLDDAEKLFYTDKQDLTIKVNVSKIVFSNGKTMEYDG